MNSHRISITAHATALLMIVAVGRVHEIIPALSEIPIAKIAMIFCFLTLFFVRKNINEKVCVTGITKLMLFIFILAIVSVTFSVYKSESLNYVTTALLGTGLIVYLILKTITGYNVLRYYIYIMIFCAAALSYGVIAYGVVIQGEMGRVSVGETLDPNDLALYLVTLLPLALSQIFLVKTKYKIVLTGIIVLMLSAIMLTGSRGGYLGLLSIALFLLLQRYPQKDGHFSNVINVKKILLIAIGIFVLYHFVTAEYWSRFSTIFNPQDDYNTHDERGRFAIWSAGLDLISKYPWGVGVAAFSSAQGSLEGGFYQTAHNSLILVAAELGIAGFMLYITLYLKVIVKLGKIIRHEIIGISDEIKYTAIGLRAGLLGFFVSSFFLSQAYSPLLYVIYTLVDRAEYFFLRSVEANLSEKSD